MRSILIVAYGAVLASGCEFDLWELLRSPSNARNACQANGAPPHQSALWHEGFPTSSLPTALCEGTIDVLDDGTICATGRVSYEQIALATGRPIFSPTALSISLNGHLLTGSANVVLGSEARFLYDFVKNYTVDGVVYSAGPSMLDNTLAASRGTLDGICLDGSFAPYGPPGYTIASTRWRPTDVNLEEFMNANLAFVSTHSVIAEFHAPADPWAGWNDGLLAILQRPPRLGGSSWSEALGMRLFNIIANLPIPSVVVSAIPGLLSLPFLLRFFLVGGTFGLEQFPLPLEAPVAAVEGIQVDTEWSTLIAAMEAGLFSSPTVSPYLGIVIKRILPGGNNSCWTEPAAAIDVQAPLGRSDLVDQYVAGVLYPALSAVGSVGLQFGKRLPAGSNVLRAALDKYAGCGAALDVETPSGCYHPMCTRTPTPTAFEYPAQYFA
jgi:hypothetical protein